ncbi:hypothetical protein C7974DRAFT_417485 [Boeremia exigua]|uniref:uncharacterized protein n=1 Tax=Boeremia exigua TaxID=749465 RepID=UPI001E8CFC4E|nr:uncharacterized protein C7974DRAFT_417485 [Boeremia exigua]KAH6615306.1 hypothetical protein C7974DRAFT_417485 [Boeremia exigua]
MSKQTYLAAREFIDAIPEDKLLGGFGDDKKCIHEDGNFRLQLRTLTTGHPQYWNIQVQCDKYSTITSVKLVAEKCDQNVHPMACVKVPVENIWSPARIKEELQADRKARSGNRYG